MYQSRPDTAYNKLIEAGSPWESAFFKEAIFDFVLALDHDDLLSTLWYHSVSFRPLQTNADGGPYIVCPSLDFGGDLDAGACIRDYGINQFTFGTEIAEDHLYFGHLLVSTWGLIKNNQHDFDWARPGHRLFVALAAIQLIYNGCHYEVGTYARKIEPNLELDIYIYETSSYQSSGQTSHTCLVYLCTKSQIGQQRLF